MGLNSWFSSLNICSISCISSLWNEKLSSLANKIFYLDWKYWRLPCQPWEWYSSDSCLTYSGHLFYNYSLFETCSVCEMARWCSVVWCRPAPPNSLLIVEHCCCCCWWWWWWCPAGPARLYLSCPRISPAPSPARSDPADPAVLRRIVRMAVLVEGQKFALSSKSQTSKSVVYVKLTDSALRSLEDYLKNKVR